ncbi:MAG: hypothetical protein H7067_11415, partial [Burkholderiales bacterium]|nr:hypothetical protein [Opitutaceae bacterium]
MKPRRRPRTTVRLLLLSALLAANTPAVSHGALTDDSATVAKTPDPLDQISHIPESNPYRATLAAWLSLPQSDRSTLGSWAEHRSPDDATPPATLTAEQQTFARQLAHDLAQTASAPATSPEDWPLRRDPNNPDDPIAVTFSEVGPLRKLTQIATKVASESPPGEATALYAATARLGRETRQGATLIQQLTGVAIEGIAQGDVARRLGEFSPAELETLSAAWKNLPAAPGIEGALYSERNLFFRPIMEKQILPGLQAYLAAGQPELDKLSNDSDAKADAAISRLRLSALVDFGDGDKQITLENRDTGDFFTVTPTRPAEGVELIDFDIPGHRAVIRVHGREAVINLETKEIVARSETLKKFLSLLENVSFADEESANDEGPLTRRAWLTLVQNHPGGPEGYYADLLARYDASFVQQLADADHAEYPARSYGAAALTNERDPILAMVTPSIGAVAR